jgi:hypothetical protein
VRLRRAEELFYNKNFGFLERYERDELMCGIICTTGFQDLHCAIFLPVWTKLMEVVFL